ncbi:MAG: hypothetical protein AAB726_00880 [Patescibacteria group bacterium]
MEVVKEFGELMESETNPFRILANDYEPKNLNEAFNRMKLLAAAAV